MNCPFPKVEFFPQCYGKEKKWWNEIILFIIVFGFLIWLSHVAQGSNRSFLLSNFYPWFEIILGLPNLFVHRMESDICLLKQWLWNILLLIFLNLNAKVIAYFTSEPYVTEDELKLMLRGAELSGAIEEEEQVINIGFNIIIVSLYVCLQNV